MIDYIFSHKYQKTYALIEYEPDDKIKFCYQGNILDFAFPDELHTLILEYDGIINDMALSLLDEVEEEIQSYGLRLKNSGDKIFCVVIKDKKEISFFTKYPTSRGFLDDYPA